MTSLTGRSPLPLLGAALLSTVGSLLQPAAAQDRPSSQAMSCAAAAALVDTQGAVVLSTGPQGYERVVRNSGLCEADMTTAPAYVPTRDQPQCFVGYRCRPVERGESRSQ